MYKIENVATTRLKEYENNPRNNEIAVDKVAMSIKQFGFLFPIVIDINYVIICGHTRKKACERLGIKNVPCIKVDDLTPEQINYFRLVDNRTSEYASWDFPRLEEELKLINLESTHNHLLLETFDLDTDFTDFDEEMTDIKVDTFNFFSENPDCMDTDGSDTDKNTDGNIDIEKSSDQVIPSPVTPQGGETNSPLGAGMSVGDSTQVPPKPIMLFFEVGKIRFHISKVELDMLNVAYTQYIDTVYPAKSFVDYLIEGRYEND